LDTLPACPAAACSLSGLFVVSSLVTSCGWAVASRFNNTLVAMSGPGIAEKLGKTQVLAATVITYIAI
jgi:hypothetical protein